MYTVQGIEQEMRRSSCRWDIPEKPKVNFAKVMELKNRELHRLSKLYKDASMRRG